MPPGVVGDVYAVKYNEGKLYVGGDFNDAGGLSVDNIAYYDFSTDQWHSIPSYFNEPVWDIAFDSQGWLYAANGNGIDRYDGNSWQQVADMNGPVYALYADGASIIFGGQFVTNFSGTQTYNSIGIYENGNVNTLGSGVIQSDEQAGVVYDIAMDSQDRILIGGNFDASGSTTLWSLAQFEEGAWVPMRNGGVFGIEGVVHTLNIRQDSELQDQQVIFVGGAFNGVGPENQPTGANNIAMFRNGNWSDLNGGVDSTVYAITTAPGGFNSVFVGGKFMMNQSGTQLNRVALWDGSFGWSTLNEGIPGDPADFDYTVHSLDTGGGNSMFAGGIYRRAGDKHVNNVSRWGLGVTSGWEALGKGINRSGEIHALAVQSNRDVYAGGNFISAGGILVSGLARWDGNRWHGVGGGVSGVIHTLAIHGDSLYVGGDFFSAGIASDQVTNISASNVALWYNSSWQSLSGGTDGPVYTMDVLASEELYIGGDFSSPHSNLAIWNGSSWLDMNNGTNGPVHTLEFTGFRIVSIVPLETSPVFAVGGSFTTAGAQHVNNLATWATDGWDNIAGGVTNSSGNATVYSIEESPTGNLYIGGNFDQVVELGGNTISAGYAVRYRWLSGWDPLAGGPEETVYDLAVNGCNLYAGGDFNSVGSLISPGIARYDGEWHFLGNGMSSLEVAGTHEIVNDVAFNGTKIFAGGNFSATGNAPSSKFGTWDNGVGEEPTSRNLAIESPSANDLLKYGEHTLIGWNHSNVDSIQIEFSTDNKQSWYPIVSSISADSGEIVWQVPDSTTQQGFIRITDQTQPCYKVFAGPFAIDGTASGNVYHLARTQQGEHDLYYPSIDGWNWANTEDNQWPDSIQSRPEYNYEDCQEYPIGFRVAVNKPSSTFPPFPTVQHALGHAVTMPHARYSCGIFRHGINTHRGPNPKGTLFWQKAAGNFQGTCAGFANASFIQFEYPGRMNPYTSTFGRSYVVPNVDSVYQHVDLNSGHGPDVRDLFNLMWARQFNRTTLLNILSRLQLSKSQLISDLQTAFTSPQGSRQLRTLSIWDMGINLSAITNLTDAMKSLRGYAHVVAPYRLERDQSNPNVWRVYIYDNNHPGEDSLFIKVNTNTDYWEYASDSVNANHQGTALFLMDPVTNYLRDNPPAPFRQSGSTNRIASLESKSRASETLQDQYLSMYHSHNNDIVIRDLDNQAMGIKDGVTVNDRFGDVLPIQPAAGKRAEPFGFFAPHEPYNITMSNLSSEVRFSVFSESQIYSYSRDDGNESQTDNLSYSESGFGVGNPDDATKQIQLSGSFVLENINWNISLSDLNMTGRDSLFETIEDQSVLRVENYGSDYSYTLDIDWSDESTGQYFRAFDVPFDSGTTHLIRPEGQFEQNGIDIFVDVNHDGVYEDTLHLDNEYSGSGEDESQSISGYIKQGYFFQDDLAFDWPSSDNFLYYENIDSQPDSSALYHPLHPFQGVTSAYGSLPDSLPFADPERTIELTDEEINFFTDSEMDSVQLEQVSMDELPDTLNQFIQARELSFNQANRFVMESGEYYILMKEQEGVAFPGLVYTNDMLYIDETTGEPVESEPMLTWFSVVQFPQLEDVSVGEDLDLVVQFETYEYVESEWNPRSHEAFQIFHGELLSRGGFVASVPGSGSQELDQNYRLLFTQLEIDTGFQQETLTDSTIVSVYGNYGRYYLAGIYDLENVDEVPWIVNGDLFLARHTPTATEPENQLPEKYKLYSNYPNPFNPTTTIKYDLPEQAKVTLKIYNSLGQEVTTLVKSKQKAGTQSVTWDGTNESGVSVASGIYFYRIKTENYVKTKKMALLK